MSSASLAVSLGKDTQGAAPIAWRGEVWGSLWVASVPGGRPLTTADIPRIVRAANEIARQLDDIAAAGRRPTRGISQRTTSGASRTITSTRRPCTATMNVVFAPAPKATASTA